MPSEYLIWNRYFIALAQTINSRSWIQYEYSLTYKTWSCGAADSALYLSRENCIFNIHFQYSAGWETSFRFRCMNKTDFAWSLLTSPCYAFTINVFILRGYTSSWNMQYCVYKAWNIAGWRHEAGPFVRLSGPALNPTYLKPGFALDHSE